MHKHIHVLNINICCCVVIVLNNSKYCLGGVRCGNLQQFSVRTIEHLNYAIHKNPLHMDTLLIQTVSMVSSVSILGLIRA